VRPRLASSNHLFAKMKGDKRDRELAPFYGQSVTHYRLELSVITLRTKFEIA